MYFFTIALVLALANVPLLLVPVQPGEARFWRRLGVQRLRRSLTRWRDPGHRHRNGETIAVARTNIRWHIVLSLLFAALTEYPALKHALFIPVRFLLIAGCAAYLLGSIVQRQKVVVAELSGGRHRH